MANLEKKELENQVIRRAREYGISTVLFRHAVGEMLGLGVTDMECLGLLFFKGLATPTELARHTGLTSGATTAMLDRLEKSGLVKRQPNPQDRRGVHIVIVKEAAQRFGPLFASGRTSQNELVASYSADQLELMADFFKKSTELWEGERRLLTSGR